MDILCQAQCRLFRASQRTARVCQRWLTKDEKGLTRKPRPECYAFGGSGFPLCSLPLAAACRCAAAVYRRAAAVCRLVVAVCCCIALAYLRVGRFSPAVYPDAARLFPAAAAGCRQQKAHDDIPSVITAYSKANFFIAISFLQMYRRISSGKSEDKMEKSLFGPLCIRPQTFSPAAVISRRNSRLMAASVSTLPPQSAISHSRRLGRGSMHQ